MNDRKKIEKTSIVEVEIDYVTRAKQVMEKLKKNEKFLTTTQIRKVLAMANRIDNNIKLNDLNKEDNLPEYIENDILSMKVKLVYQMGRYEEVRLFVKESRIDKEIDKLKNGKVLDFKKFFNYLEALVAYRKLQGGDR